MTTIERRLSRLERATNPRGETEFSQQLLTRLDAGRERSRAAREALGVSMPAEDDDPLPPIPADTFRGMTITRIQIYLLHRGRERNYLRCLAARNDKWLDTRRNR